MINRAVIGGKERKSDRESFVRYGATSSGAPEPKLPGLDEACAEILRTGKVVFGNGRKS